MFHGNDFSLGPISDSPAVNVRHIPIDAGWPAAPLVAEDLLAEQLADSVVRSWRERRIRLQRTIDAVESQVALLDETGEIAAVNRAWRMTAKMNGLAHARHGVGMNYLTVCRSGAMAGEKSATLAAEGIEGVLEGRSRSFYLKYGYRADGERQIYAMLAWRVIEDGTTYVAISHELLESHAE